MCTNQAHYNKGHTGQNLEQQDDSLLVRLCVPAGGRLWCPGGGGGGRWGVWQGVGLLGGGVRGPTPGARLCCYGTLPHCVQEYNDTVNITLDTSPFTCIHVYNTCTLVQYMS